MRLLAAVLILAPVALAVGPPPAAQAPPAAAGRPKLAVLLVVDQLRTDYLEQSRSHFRAGFRRLLTEGAVFDHGEYPYMNTVTCAGHSTIGTGTLPRTHGMTLNCWYDRATGHSISCNDDPESTVVTYGGKESKTGTSAKNLLVPTLADEMRAQLTGVRVVSMSLKARSAIGMAGQAGDAVTWVDDTAAAFSTSRAYAASRVPQVAAFFARDPVEGDGTRNWPLRDAPSTYRYPDASLGGRPQTGRTGLFPHKVGTAKGPDDQFFALWQASPYSDAYLGRMATAMVDAFALGQRDATDFLGVSLSALDLIGHTFGPESREVEDMVRRLDDTIGALMTHLDIRVGRGNWVLGFSSDHGVAPIGSVSGGGRIVTDDIRDKIEEALITRWGPRAEGSYVASVTFNYVYFSKGIYQRLTEDAAAYAAMEKAALEVPGLVRVVRGERLSAASTDRDIRAAALSYHPGRSGDLALFGKVYWYFSQRGDLSGTTHGTNNPYDRLVPVIVMVGGIKPGRYAGAATPADLAPTLAQLVGVKMPKAEGRVLWEALTSGIK
jgi:predicted AlkP superfamily pyrophosphatase or phosphodiesterase